MYKIKTAKVEEVLEYVTYVKLQSNGVIITCDSKEEAHGVLNKDHSLIYAFKDSPIADRYEVAEVTIIALDEYLQTYLKQQNISTLPDRVGDLEAQNKALIDGVNSVI